MYSKKRIFSFIIIVCALSFGFFAFFMNPGSVFADGLIIGSQGEIFPEPGQKAAIIWDKDLKKETLILNTSFGIDSLSKFCWIIPIHSSVDPNVRASDNEIFAFLEGLFPIYTRGDWSQYPTPGALGGYGIANIEVISIKKIGVYELATLWADDPNVLTEWLEDNSYNVPSDFATRVDFYTSVPDGCYFVANKINIENEFASPLESLHTYNQEVYETLISDELDTTKIDDLLDDLKYDIAKDIRDGNDYDPNSFAGYIMDQDDYEDLQDAWSAGDITSAQVRNEVKNKLVSSELFQTIIDLFEGAGTPVEITFYPSEPIYPLYISSMATNYGGIEVYFIGPYAVEDENNILRYSSFIELNSYAKSDLEDLADLEIPDSCHYVTLLTYRGYMDSLDNDSIFIRSRQSQSTPIVMPPPYYPAGIIDPYFSPYSSPYVYQSPVTYFNFPSWPTSNYLYGGFYSSYFSRPYSFSSYPGFYGSYSISNYFSRPFGSIYSGGILGGLYGGSFLGGLYGGGLYGGSIFGGGLYGRTYRSTFNWPPYTPL